MLKRQFTGRMRRFAGVLTTISLMISMAACGVPQGDVNTGAAAVGITGLASAQESAAAGAEGVLSAQESAAAGAEGVLSVQEPAAAGAMGVLSAQESATAGAERTSPAIDVAGTGATGAVSAQESAAAGTTGVVSAQESAAAGAAGVVSESDLAAVRTAGIAGTEERPLRVHLAGMPGTPDPSGVMDADTASLLKLVSEGLTVLDENGEPAPGAAKAWEISEDGLVWTFTLRDDLRWSDGQALEASAFAAIFRQTADPSSEVLYGRHLTRNIAGYEDVLNGEKDALEVFAEDADTLIVRLTAPDPDFARKCASWALLPVRELIRKDSADTEGTEEADISDEEGTEAGTADEESAEAGTADEESAEDGTADAENAEDGTMDEESAEDGTANAESADGADPAVEEKAGEADAQAADAQTDMIPPSWETLTGNGPYTVESFQEGEGYLLKKNPYYHAGEKRPFDAVQWMVSGDANEEYSGFLNGEMDAFSGIPAEEEAMLTGSGAFQKNRTAQESAPGNELFADGNEPDQKEARFQDQKETRFQEQKETRFQEQKEARFQDQKEAQSQDQTAVKEAEGTAEVSPGTASDNASELAPYYDQTIVPDTLGLLFNCGKEELEDPRVRRALSMAADRAYIASAILGGLYAPVASLAADDDPLSHAPAEALLSLMETNESLRHRIEGDTEEAKELLAAAGYPDGKGFPVLTCLAGEDDASYLIAEYLVSVWKDLGIEIRVEPEKAEDIAQEKEAGTFDILCGSIFLASDVVSEELAGYVTDSDENVCGFSSESYDRLLAGAAEEDEEETGGEDPDAEKFDVEEPDAEKSDEKESDAEKSDAEESDAEKSDAEKSDAEESDAEKSDAEKSDAEKSDEKESDSEKSDAEESDAEKSDEKESGAEEPGTEESEAEKSDAEKSDAEETEKEKEKGSEEEKKQAGEEASRTESDKKTAASSEGWTDTEYAGRMQEAVKILAQDLPCAPLAMRRYSWLRSEACAGIFCDVSGCWQIWKTRDTDSGAAAVGRQEAAAAEQGAEGSAPGNASDDAGNAPDNEGNAPDDAGNSPDNEGNAPDNAGNAPDDEGNAPDDAGDTDKADKTDKAEKGGDGEKKESGLLKRLFPDREEKSEEGFESPFVGKIHRSSTQKPDNFLTRLFSSDNYFEKADTSAWLTRQAWLLGGTGNKATRLVSLPKYTQVHLTGTGNERYARIDVDGKFHYLEADRVTADENVLQQLRREEEEQNLQAEMLTASMHEVKESELADHAADVRAETERVLAEIEHHERIKTQTRNPNWDGPVLSRSKGSVTGPSGKETYYNLNMSGVVNIMRRMGNTDEYWVRDDGCKMLGDYIMCAANLSVHPRGSLVESSLGTCIVCDTGGFASRNANQLDIAVTW